MDHRPAVTGVITLALAVTGLGAGMLTSGEQMCTLKGCPCQEDGERPCNSCTKTDPMFVTGLVNVVKSCSGTQVLTCQDGEQVDSRVEYNTCEYSVTFFRMS